MSRIADKMIEIQEAIYAQGSVVDIDAVARECGVPVQWVEDEWEQEQANERIRNWEKK